MRAAQLSADYIGALIVFRHQLPNGTVVTERGELRQISHTSDDTVLQITERAEPHGELREFVLEHDTLIAWLVA